MSDSHLQDINNFLSKLGPREQLLNSHGKVGCNVCKFSISRNFNSKAKLVNHFKSTAHWEFVNDLEAKKGEHIKTVEDRLLSVNQEIEELQNNIDLNRTQIDKIDNGTKRFKTWLMLTSNDKVKEEIMLLNKKREQFGTVNEEDVLVRKVSMKCKKGPANGIEADCYKCPTCPFKSQKLKKFKKHLFGHHDAASEMLLAKITWNMR